MVYNIPIGMVDKDFLVAEKNPIGPVLGRRDGRGGGYAGTTEAGRVEPRDFYCVKKGVKVNKPETSNVVIHADGI